MEIRDVRLSDTKDILDIYKPYVLNTAVSFEYEVPTLKEFQTRIENISSKYPYLVALEDNTIIGYAYASSYSSRAAYKNSVELSIYLKEGTTHHGVGTTLYNKLLEKLKKQGIKMVYACIVYPYDTSVNFHYKQGFKMIGVFHQAGYKFDKYYDVCWMEKEL
ncbi:MAG: GNAT family N-acetyltransferase [Thomasclavelia sp.]|nr:GNAT family N-acetyltransferase [Thomasclavelia sp.]